MRTLFLWNFIARVVEGWRGDVVDHGRPRGSKMEEEEESRRRQRGTHEFVEGSPFTMAGQMLLKKVEHRKRKTENGFLNVSCRVILAARQGQVGVQPLSPGSARVLGR